ncbi:helix-turn-helix domain-containing protein [Pirellulaceae bacterium SH467]
MKYPPKSRSPLENQILGSELGLTAVRRLASIHSQSASRISWHQHDCYEILLLADGSTTYEFRNGDHAVLSGGQFLVIPPWIDHRGVNDVRSPVRLTGVMLDTQARNASRLTPFDAKEFREISRTIHSSSIETRKMGMIMRNIVRGLSDDFQNVRENNQHALPLLRIRVCQLLIEVAKQLKSPQASGSKQLVEVAIEYMRSHLFESRSIEDVAFRAGCSRARLFAVFKEETGMTPNDYWQRLRIESSQQLLRSTEKSITEIAIHCGFSTSQYFSSVFRKYVGTTPKEYRNASHDLPTPWEDSR